MPLTATPLRRSEDAEITGQYTRYPSMEIALTQGSLAWTADGVQLPAMRQCSQIFASLFEPKGGIDAQQRLRRKEILDDNLKEVRSLEKKMGVQDKGRMDQYLTSVQKPKFAPVVRTTGWTPPCRKSPMLIANAPTGK